MKRFCIILLVLLYFVPAGQTLAAQAEQIPIVMPIGGDEMVIGYGRNIDGSVYVPLRLLFEMTFAEVDYQPVGRLITIRRADGAVLTMFPGDKQAQIKHLGENKILNMPAAARLIDGVTYVSLRFAGENLMCAVVWDNEAKKVFLRKYFALGWPEATENRYTVDFMAEQVYETSAGGTTRLLGMVPGLRAEYERMAGWCYYWQVYHIEKNEQGSYLVNLSGILMDAPTSRYVKLLLTEDGQFNRLGGQAGAVFYDNSIWWPEGNKVRQLDAATGKLLAEYNCNDYLADLPGAVETEFCFCDGEYVLFNYATEQTGYESLPALANLQTGEVIDLFPKLIPENERAAFLYYNDPSSSLSFVKADNGVLYFDYQKDVYTNHKELSLTYKYK